MSEIIILSFVAVVFFALGWVSREVAAVKKVNKLLAEVKIEEEETKKELDKVIFITIEIHNGTFFVYNKKDNSFMAQGTDIRQVEDALLKRYPGKRFAADPENLRGVGVIPNESV